MRKYEVMVIIDPEVDERQVPDLVEKHLKVVTAAGGTVENTDIWGKRRLAYEINKKHEGIYVVLTLQAEPDVVKELDRRLKIDESVLRDKVLRLEN